MTEIDPARKRGDGGEDVATGLRNKQIIGCQSGVARCLLLGGEIWWGLCV